ncbi:MAG: LysM peptidoglycan-binding domain-containing protein [Chitinophagales bacterium]
MRPFTLALACALALAVGLAGAQDAAAHAPGVTAAAYAVLDVDKGVFLLEHHADDVREPASLTKIMTALVAVDQAPLGKVGKVSASAAATGGNRVGLWAGQKLEMWELLYGALFCSGNDAAEALAETVAGSEPAFVKLMNAKARSLGLKVTTFQNPHGLSEAGHVSTARELALLGRAALRQPIVAKIVGRTERTLPWGGEGRSLYNINKFLHLYPGALGLKTGYTGNAGYCLLASAKRDGHTLVVSVLGATSSAERYNDAIRLLDAAFASYKVAPARPDLARAGAVPVASRTRYYVIQRGDTLSAIARRLGLSQKALIAANSGLNPDRIRAGDRLRLP